MKCDTTAAYAEFCRKGEEGKKISKIVNKINPYNILAINAFINIIIKAVEQLAYETH